MRRGMRIIVPVCVISVLACVLNVVVAWAFIAFGTVAPLVDSTRTLSAGQFKRPPLNQDLVDALLKTYMRSEAGVIEYRWEGRGLTARSTQFFNLPSKTIEPATQHDLHIQTAYSYEAGWPMRSLSYQQIVPARGSAWTFSLHRPQWLGPPDFRSDGRSKGAFGQRPDLPYRPEVAGFFANTVLYALVLGLVFLVPMHVRRVRRQGVGRCVACGYDRRGLTVGGPCPECGRAGPRPR